MKTLLILRHAKSSWKFPDVPDHDRPLNKRGKHDAPIMGRILKQKHLVPDLIISSTATRAWDTASIVAKISGYKGKKSKLDSLYAAEPEAYLRILRKLSDKHDRVLMVGHNPGIEELIEKLTGDYRIMPTCALAHIEFNIEKWSEILYGRTKQATLIDIIRARESE
jgi:phosphohistidine phosphatase